MATPRPWPTLVTPESWRERSEEEHAQGIELACRAAMQILDGAHDRGQRLARIDPIPPSTRALLRRLARR